MAVQVMYLDANITAKVSKISNHVLNYFCIVWCPVISKKVFRNLDKWNLRFSLCHIHDIFEIRVIHQNSTTTCDDGIKYELQIGLIVASVVSIDTGKWDLTKLTVIKVVPGIPPNHVYMKFELLSMPLVYCRMCSVQVLQAICKVLHVSIFNDIIN